MVSPEIENSIAKYFTHAATAAELDLLNRWIEDPTHQVIFKEYVKTNFAITLGMNDPDLHKIRKTLLEQIRKDKKTASAKRTFSFFKYAAIAILCTGLGYFLQQGLSQQKKGEVVVPQDSAITLELDNGEVQVISEQGKSQVKDMHGKVMGSKDGKKLVYEMNTSEKELSYNTLTIPNGKRFDLVLSDGTQVFLNAGSSLRYPVHFIAGKKREVFLDGEAFFEVAHDAENAFTVNVNEIEVEVYGTRFNVSNYPEDEDTEVVLVKGSVGLSLTGLEGKEKGPVVLKPGFKGAFDKTGKVIVTKKVNTSMYTSWMDGEMVFRNAPFTNIVQKLERQYNVTIVNNNEKLGREHFNATIETQNESIEQVLSYFNKIYQIEYTIVENKIIIN
ncbi:MAG: FecR domain-containing protein [Sediminicola sp.]|tara:strand:+ start:75273 stop:76436 length:1164 start_codon:yes stop_codon:yes gene_type:complete